MTNTDLPEDLVSYLKKDLILQCLSEVGDASFDVDLFINLEKLTFLSKEEQNIAFPLIIEQHRHAISENNKSKPEQSTESNSDSQEKTASTPFFL